VEYLPCNGEKVNPGQFDMLEQYEAQMQCQEADVPCAEMTSACNAREAVVMCGNISSRANS
jgi:hypothetical protein